MVIKLNGQITSLPEYEKSEGLLLFPNPAYGSFSIIAEAGDNALLKLFNEYGNTRKL